jgi:hypothetical protein
MINNNSEKVKMKIRYGLCSLQIFNAILLHFSRRLRNSPRPWVRHIQRPALLDSLEKPHPKAKSSMSLQPHLIFIRSLDDSINWRESNFLNHPGWRKKVEFYYLPDMKQDRRTVIFGMNIAIFLYEKMEMYINFKGGDQSFKFLKNNIIREKCGVNFTPELLVTFSQFILGKKEERIAKII